MKVRAGTGAGAAGLTDRLSDGQPLAWNDVRAREVRVEDGVAAAFVDRDYVAVSLVAGEPAGAVTVPLAAARTSSDRRIPISIPGCIRPQRWP